MFASGRTWSLALFVALLAAGGSAQAGWRTIETDYYLIKTDLGDDVVQEAILRTNVMVKVYFRYLGEGEHKLKEKLDLVLFSNRVEFVRATGSRDCGGQYNGRQLLVYVGSRATEGDWATVQHEAFHQFAHRVMGGDIPTWANEGLANYFGCALFTGDDYILGAVPKKSWRKMQTLLNGNRLTPLGEFLQISGKEWGHDMSIKSRAGRNYLQAWSVVYFLMHADNGKHRADFRAFLRDTREYPWRDAWARRFGEAVGPFDTAWKQYWKSFRDDPTENVRAEAIAATLTNYLARAAACGQTFRNPGEFFAAGQAGGLRQPAGAWLPPRLIHARVQDAMQLGTWTLAYVDGRAELVCHTKRGWIAGGCFKIKNGEISDLQIKVVADPARQSLR